jgi:hypothetical protein
MVGAIIINGPLAAAIERYPSFWVSSSRADFQRFLQESHRIDRAVVLFALSNLSFIFAIPFFSGLRVLVSRSDATGFLRSTVGTAVALFLAGGLASEVFSHGVPVVIRSVPGYQASLDTVLMVQGLQYVALVQGQVALGVALLALSFSGLRREVVPHWIWWLGLPRGSSTWCGHSQSRVLLSLLQPSCPHLFGSRQFQSCSSRNPRDAWFASHDEYRDSLKDCLGNLRQAQR